MTKNKNPSASPESALGFSFQDVYSLYLLLKDERSDLELWIENLDDIHIKDKNGNLTLYQLKHKVNKLSDKSSDLWNTIGNWCKLIKDGKISIDTTSFKLVVITEILNTQKAYSLCKKYGNYNPTKAHDELLKIANKDIETKRNKQKKSEKQGENIHPDLFELPEEQEIEETDYELFAKKLHYNTRESLVNSIEIIDNTSNVTTLDARIPSMLNGVYPDNQKAVYSDLIGWWHIEIRRHLSDKSVSPLTKTALINKIAKINEAYHKDNLPQNYDRQDLEKYRSSIDIKNNNKNFVQELKKITTRKKRIERAMLDFYLATNKRMEWATEKLLIDGEIETYENRLVEYWERITEDLIDSESFALDNTEDIGKREFGLKIYTETEKQNIPPIRQKVTEKYIKMGSYHLLVEDDKICWYPEGVMLELFETI